MTTTHETDENEEVAELAPDSEFESFYDNDSGVWTLRRIPSTPPACATDDLS